MALKVCTLKWFDIAAFKSPVSGKMPHSSMLSSAVLSSTNNSAINCSQLCIVLQHRLR